MTFRFSFNFINAFLIAVIFSLHLSAVVTLAQTPRYTVTHLGPVSSSPNGLGEAFAINNSGQVVGYNSYPEGEGDFLYSNGVMRSLGAGLSAHDINDAGQIVGSFIVSAPDGDRRHAVLYSDGVMTDLGRLPNSWASSGLHINTPGQVAGISIYFFGPYQLNFPFLYSNGIMQAILGNGLVGWGIAQPGDPDLAINDAGQVVSSYYAGRAFIYSDGIRQDIGALPGDDRSQGQAINNHGQVAGVSFKTNPGYPANLYLYSGGVMQDLGSLGGTSPGRLGTVRSMNNSGQIVGSFWPENVNRLTAFLYNDGVLSDLNTLIPADSGWELTIANDINESGQIVGRGLFNGNRRAFLLTPRRGRMKTITPRKSPTSGKVSASRPYNSYWLMRDRRTYC